MPRDPVESKYVTVHDAAVYLHRPASFVLEKIRDGSLRQRRWTNGATRVLFADLDELLARLERNTN